MPMKLENGKAQTAVVYRKLSLRLSVAFVTLLLPFETVYDVFRYEMPERHHESQVKFPAHLEVVAFRQQRPVVSWNCILAGEGFDWIILGLKRRDHLESRRIVV